MIIRNMLDLDFGGLGVNYFPQRKLKRASAEAGGKAKKSAPQPQRSEPKTSRRAHEDGYGRVLVMDDEPPIREVVAHMLRQMGYRVTEAADGNRTLELYRQATQTGDRFDWLLMDLNLPKGPGGVETLRRLRQIDPGVKAIVFSGYYQDPVMAQYLDYGFRGMLAKPFTFRGLEQAMLQAGVAAHLDTVSAVSSDTASDVACDPSSDPCTDAESVV